MKKYIILAILSTLFIASPSYALECPGNTVSLGYKIYHFNVYGPSPDISLCTDWAENHAYPSGGGYYDGFDPTNGPYGSCKASKSGSGSITRPIVEATIPDCGCASGANTIVNSSGDTQWCSDETDWPDPEPTIEECGNSWDAYSGGCGTLPADCAASGGAFGWVNVGSGDQIVCMPAGEGGEPPVCGVDGFICNDLMPSTPGGENPSNTNDPDAPETAGTNPDGGVDGTESGGTGANETGTCVPGTDANCTGANGWGDPCDPSVDANCTPVAAGDGESNDEKGTCDPEQPGYFECITSGGISVDPGQYEPGDRTIDSIFGEFSTAMENAVIVTGIEEFFAIDVTGSCPVWSVQTSVFDITIDQLCSDQIPWDLIYGVMLAVASLLAARIAFT